MEVGAEIKTIGIEERFLTEEVVAAWSRLGSAAREDSPASADAARRVRAQLQPTVRARPA